MTNRAEPLMQHRRKIARVNSSSAYTVVTRNKGFAAMADIDNAVLLRDIVKTYRRGKEKIEVLHHLDLSVRSGEFLALMGPSGSGKTTVLNLIGGLDRPDSG